MLRSPLYLAPEVWSEEETDARSDIYSLGVILYQLLTGDVPFKGKSIPAIMKQHLINLPPAIAGNNGVSAELEEVVMHALAKNPEERPATVEEFVEELQFVVGDGGTATIVRPKSAAVVKEKREGTAQSFAGDTTLADHRIEDTIVAPPVDMDKTIVLSRTDLRSMRSSIIEEEQTSTPVGPTNFDMTIVPGMVKQIIFESRPVEIEVALPEVCDQPLPVGNEEPEDELQEEPEDSTFSEVPYDEPPPRTISPVLLAIGVFLIVVLIGVGVYYSRTID
jgi:serine/threonine protein kinase